MTRAHRLQTLKDPAGKKTTFSVDHNRVVYDNINGTLHKVGEILSTGEISVRTKYSKRYGNRLDQLRPKEGAAQ